MRVRELIITLLDQPMAAKVVVQAGSDPLANMELQRVHYQLTKDGPHIRLSYEREQYESTDE